MLEGLAGLWIPISDPFLILLIAAGTFSGIYVGAIPGLSVTMAVSLLISFTFSWDMFNALALMTGVFAGGVYGGSRSAILLNIPGAPAAIATSFDGYPLAKLGLAGETIGTATIQSFLGGMMGLLIMVFATPIMSQTALAFAPRDYFLIASMGLLLIGSLGGKAPLKGILMGLMGVILGLTGMDPFTGEGRFTFGSLALMGGIDYVVAMIGLFGVSEAISQIELIGRPVIRQKLDGIIPLWSEIIRHVPLTLRASAIGAFIGALPGAGGDIAALLAYDHARRTVKKPQRPFGEGAVEGVIAPEAANNAAVGGAFIPMLTLGIPGDSVTAVILGALFIHGLRPGPLMMSEKPEIFWFFVSALFLSNIFMLIFGLMGVRVFSRIVEIPKQWIIPTILILSMIGAYAIRGRYLDLVLVVIFGVVGYALKQNGYPTGPVILGMILGPMIDSNFRRAALSAGSLIGVLVEIFTNPISLVLFTAIGLLLISGIRLGKRL